MSATSRSWKNFAGTGLRSRGKRANNATFSFI